MATTLNYAAYAEQTLDEQTVEMSPGMPNRYFNVVEAGPDKGQIYRNPGNYAQIVLGEGTYRISGVSFVTMVAMPPAGQVEVPPVATDFLVNIYPGYCILYDANKEPPTPADMTNCICLGTMGTAYDSGPSTFDCIKYFKGGITLSLGHQCSYDSPKYPFPKVYERVGGTKYHVVARIVIQQLS